MSFQSSLEVIFKKLSFFWIFNLLILIYIFIAFLPQPLPINIGLDPSWNYAISQASQQKAIFGKDIIFTYGPLGYLIAGSILEDNFLQILIFRWLIYLLLCIVSIFRIITIENFTHRLFTLLSIVCALYVNNYAYSITGMTTDYQILFIFLITLSFHEFFKKNIYLLSLVIGAISGLCILTKLTLGIYIFGSLSIFLIVSSIGAKSRIDSVRYIISILNSFLATISVACILLIPDRASDFFVKIIGSLFVSIIISLSIFLIQRLINRREYLNVPHKKEDILIPSAIFYSLYILSLFYIIQIEQSIPLVKYIRSSIEITSGFSSAMSTPGSDLQLAVAISNLLVIIYLMFLSNKEGIANLSLGLLLILFLSFKHGFVRQDAHVITFASITPLITSIIAINTSKLGSKKTLHYLFAYILLSSLFVTQIASPLIFTVSKLTPKRVLANIIHLTDVKSFKLKTDKEKLHNLARLELPDRAQMLVANKSVDIVPWEISLVPANDLNWKPRPIFQSYSAYTTALDDLNFDSLSQEPRNYILYQFQSIDGRHPFFDEPKTFNYLFCNYQPSPQLTGAIKIPNLRDIFLLEKLAASRCVPTAMNEKSSIAWNVDRAIAAKDRELIRASIKFQYSLVGKIYKTLFRAPAVMMKVDYLDGSQKYYRIIPENSENGVIVSHLPTDDNEAMAFWQGKLPKSVKSFSFQTSKSFVYAPKIEIGFSSAQLR